MTAYKNMEINLFDTEDLKAEDINDAIRQLSRIMWMVYNKE